MFSSLFEEVSQGRKDLSRTEEEQLCVCFSHFSVSRSLKPGSAISKSNGGTLDWLSGSRV